MLVDKEIEEASEGGFARIYTLLQIFRDEFTNHLDLENNIFYPALIGSMEREGKATETLHEFIAEMKNIEKDIYLFLEKYKDERSIGEYFSSMRGDLAEVVKILDIRLSSEESGVYLMSFS
jgi:hemerythrin-like domain-containing protein